MKVYVTCISFFEIRERQRTSKTTTLVNRQNEGNGTGRNFGEEAADVKEGKQPCP